MLFSDEGYQNSGIRSKPTLIKREEIEFASVAKDKECENRQGMEDQRKPFQQLERMSNYLDQTKSSGHRGT